MHVMAVLDARKKRGHFNDYNQAQKTYELAVKAADLAEAGLEGTSAETTSKRRNKNRTKLLNTMYLADMIVFLLHL